jgi:hypothetical protein
LNAPALTFIVAGLPAREPIDAIGVVSAESDVFNTVGPVPSPTITEEASVYVEGPRNGLVDWTKVTVLGPTRRSVLA